ncbi:LbtU family siderophore porin [Legionella norrlandica]|uniref:LbtU family siderophore porin n=1 Tax=Legionella norrlandica TaxID=1498499 RepID=UPI003B9811B3
MISNILVFANTGNTLFKSEKFTYDGHIFFNATNSAIQGEKYLLNQQLSNIKLGSELHVTDWNKIKGLLIFNTLPTPVAPQLYLEQFYDEFQIPSSNAFFSIGKKWLTFGSYKSDLIYKPLTKALGQTNEVTAVFGYDSSFYTNASFFEPYSRVKSSSLPLYYNLNTGLHNETVDVGASYLYSLADSQLFQYNKGFGGFLSHSLKTRVPGFATYLNVKHKKTSTYLTYVSAVSPFAIEDLSYNNKRALPKAFSVQSSYDINTKKIPIKITGFYDYSFQALALGLPEQRIGVGLSANPSPYLSIQFQYSKDYGYGNNAIATGLNHFVSGRNIKTNNFALQAVLNF